MKVQSEVLDIIGILKGFEIPFIDYPAASFVHLLVGAIAGWHLCCGREQSKYGMDGTSASLMGIAIFGAWIAYELAEMSRIGDSGDKDIAVGLFGVFIGITVGKIIWHYGTEHIRSQHEHEPPKCSEDDSEDAPEK